MKPGYEIQVNNGYGLSEDNPVIGVFNFTHSNSYRAHATDASTLDYCDDNTVAIFKIRARETA